MLSMHRILPGYCGFWRIQLSMSCFSCLARNWKTNSSVLISSTYNTSSIMFVPVLTSPILQKSRGLEVPRSYCSDFAQKLHLLVRTLTSYLFLLCNPMKTALFKLALLRYENPIIERYQNVPKLKSLRTLIPLQRIGNITLYKLRLIWVWTSECHGRSIAENTGFSSEILKARGHQYS